MYNHKSEVIDDFVMALLPSVIRKMKLDRAIRKPYLHSKKSEYDDVVNDYVNDVYSIAEKLFIKHSETCEICNENADQPEGE